jgi:hypothetical protein
MKRMLLTLALFGMTAGAAMADPLDLTGGVFILHAPPGIDYTVDPPPEGWCGEAIWVTDCPGQVNTIPGDDVTEHVWYILNNFWESKTFKAVEYGIVYDPDLYLYAVSQLCTPSAALTIEHPATGAWPAAGSGISIALTGEPYWSGTMVATGMIHGFHYTYFDPTTITLGPMPASGSIGWLSPNLTTYPPACIGVLGIDMAGVACCSEAPVYPQACCFADGHCADLLPAVCVEQGGVVYPDLCDATDCPQPPHACCFEDGSCVVLLAADCLAQGGVVYEELTCDGVECLVPPRACCFADGHCEVLSQTNCEAMGGVVYPDLDCTTVVCPVPTQACCFCAETCVELTPADCEAQGGVVYPELDCDPNPCTGAILMACCLESGDCVDLGVQEECDALGGVLYPEEQCCAGFVCPTSPEEWACCFAFDEDCYMLTEADCLAGGGMWHDGVDCASFSCSLWRVCCVEWVCHIRTEAGCAELGGVWYVDWTTCDPNPCLSVPSDPSSWGAIKSIYR